MAQEKSIMILEGNSGHAFFFRETLLAQGIAGSIDLVGSIEEAFANIKRRGYYDLIITDLEENWEEGLRIGFEYRQHIKTCRLLVLAPPDVPLPADAKAPLIIKHKPATLREFVQLVRNILQPAKRAKIDLTQVQRQPREVRH